jgi:hypothetical protein
MQRRLFSAICLVIVLSMTVPVFAAPQRDAGQTVLDRIVLKLRKIFTPRPLDLQDPAPPKP